MTWAGFAFVDLEGFTPVQAWNSCLEQKMQSQPCPSGPWNARPCVLLRSCFTSDGPSSLLHRQAWQSRCPRQARLRSCALRLPCPSPERRGAWVAPVPKAMAGEQQAHLEHSSVNIWVYSSRRCQLLVYAGPWGQVPVLSVLTVSRLSRSQAI
jgi:hypothetical protein